MRKFSDKKILRMTQTERNPQITYKPFTGKCPTRLLVQLRQYNKKTGKSHRRFFYHGKFNSGVLLKAYKLWLGSGHSLESQIAEYHQNGLVMAGTFGGLALYTYHNLAHFDSPMPVNGSWRWVVGVERPAQEVSVSLGRHNVMVNKASIPSDDKQKRQFLASVRLVVRKREMGKAA